MIITVTLNPAADRTIGVDRLQTGGLNRVWPIRTDAGGKGINVSRTLKALGQDSVAVGFLAGSTGDFIENRLHELNIATDFVRVSGETRTNLKVVSEDGTVTELNEKGPTVTAAETELLMEKLYHYASPETLVVLSGSMPGGCPSDLYEKIILEMHKKGAKVLLDADGESFAHAIKAKPDLIKPNREELLRYLQKSENIFVKNKNRQTEKNEANIGEKNAETEGNTIDLLKKACRNLKNNGIAQIALSMGSDGAIFFADEGEWNCQALPVPVRSTVGAGDAMAAALAYSFERKLPEKEKILLAMAVSAGAVTTEGTNPPTLDQVENLKKTAERYVTNLK